MSSWPTWTEMMLIAAGIGGAITWLDARLGMPRKIAKLQDKIESAESEVQKAKSASIDTVREKNNEIDLIRTDRDQWKDRAMYWRGQVHHLERLSATRGG